jgi:hypothetical protein
MQALGYERADACFSSEMDDVVDVFSARLVD